jgi:hypothetical protein
LYVIINCRMNRKIDKRGLENSDKGALNPDQIEKCRQLKVKVQKIDENYVRAHPELDTMVYEFIREVLHRRPADFNTFSADWFSNPNLENHINNRMKQRKENRDLEFVHDLDPMSL